MGGVIAVRGTRRSSVAVGALCGSLTGIVWGGQFVVGKSALGRVDAFWLTTVRYAGAAAILLALLAAVEGRNALSPRGRTRQLFVLGTLGFACFTLLAYAGLEHARPQSASLIVALSPLLTALVLWARNGVRPSGTTVAALAVALGGVALVISRGHPVTLWHGSLGSGDLLVLGGVLSFVLYTIGAGEHRDLSPLRFTALTVAAGWPAMLVATLVGTAAGWLALPSGGDFVAVAPQIAYLTVPGVVFAVLSWNAAVERLGPQTTSLFANLIPVSTFTIEIVRGYRPGPLELVGGALTVGALVAHNLALRRHDPVVPTGLPAEAQSDEPLVGLRDAA